MMRRAAYRLARQSGLLSLFRRVRPGAVVLCYHNVLPLNRGVSDPALHMPFARLTEQMSWLSDHLDIVPLEDILNRASSGRDLRGIAAITFDDAYVGTLSHALPFLRKMALPSTIFVPTAFPSSGRSFWWDHPAAAAATADDSLRTSWLDQLQGDGERIHEGIAAVEPPPDLRPASWEQLSALSSGLVSVESHSVSHRNLASLSDEELRRELRESADVLEAQTGRRPKWIAYPYGRWDHRVARETLAAGYRGGWTLDGSDITANTDWGAAPRVNIPANLSLDAFAAWVSGLAHWRS
jgi:peptidoglycan/xylan/chitin deacetylase (PgdA/CDA1 family)